MWLSGISFAQGQDIEPVTVKGDEVEYFPDEKKVVGAGNVSIEYQGAKLTADRLTFYTDTQTGFGEHNVHFESPPLYGRGERIDLLHEEGIRLTDGYITTCDRDPPHYRLNIRQATVHPGDRVAVDRPSFYAGKIPLFYLPHYNYSIKESRQGIDIIPGRQKLWGFYALTFTRFRLNENAQGNIRLDYRENWGEAEGLDYKYKFKNSGEGLFKTYYAHQIDRTKNRGEAAEFERHRVSLRHRYKINNDTLANLDYNRFSDINFRKDFFYRDEFDKEANPQNLFSIVSSKTDYTTSFVLKKRVNRFENVTERLPELRFDQKQKRIFHSNLYYRNQLSLANLTNKYAAPSSLDDDADRFDMFNELSYSGRTFGWLYFKPHLGMRQTYYNKDKQGSDREGERHIIRGLLSPGLALSARFYRDFQNVRHIINPTIDYSYISEPTHTVDTLLQFDSVDNISHKNSITLSLENRLKTKSVDLLRFITSAPYNFALEDGARWQDLFLDLELAPSSNLRIESDITYEPMSRDFKRVNLDMVAQDSDDWSLGIGSRYQQNSRHEITVACMRRLSNKLKVSILERFDPKAITDGTKYINHLKEQQYAVTIDLHCWLAEFTFSTSDERGSSVFLAFRLKSSPEAPFQLKTNYYQPKAISSFHNESI